MDKPRILVTRAVFPEVLDRLEEYFEVESNQDDRIFSTDELVAKAAGKAGIFSTPSERISADVLAASPSLKAVCNMAEGYHHPDVAAATNAGDIVPHTPDPLTQTTAQFR